MLATLTSAVPYIFRSLVQSLADLNHETFLLVITVTQKVFTLTPLYENLLDVVYSTMTYEVGHGVDPSSGSLIQCVFTKFVIYHASHLCVYNIAPDGHPRLYLAN